MQAYKPYLVGITGGSASGKTRFLESLEKIFAPHELCILSQDHYYRSAEFHIRDENGEVNYDLPECIDYARFISDLEALGRGETIEIKEYLFQQTDVEPRLLKFYPARVIVIEGLFIFYFEEIFKLLDLKVFIDAADDVKLQRRIKRDTTERGIPYEQVLYQWTNHVLPAYEKYLLPFKNASDMIVNNNEHFNNSLKVLENHFRHILHH